MPEFQIHIDLIPFGKLEKERRIYLPGSQEELSVLGFLEVLGTPVEINYSDFILRMPSLAGLTILKLLAWSDRPTHRSQDLGDIYKIILHYSDLHFQEILTNHPDLIPQDSEPDWILIGAELLGRHAKDIARESKELVSKISSLPGLTQNQSIPNPFAQIWSGQFGGTLEYTRQIANTLARGFSR